MKIELFLKKYNAHPDNVDIKKHAAFFIEDMEKGLSGKASSLKMIPTYINSPDVILPGEKVIALDAGGTNFRKALVFFDKKNSPVISEFSKSAMPGVSRTVDKEEFFSVLAKECESILDESGKIGFCFSYPAEMAPDKDGKLISLSKELNVKNIVGERIGENLNNKIVSLGHEKKKIVILNDTVSVLLSGISEKNKNKYSAFLGFILGTGTNVCYIEKNKNIKKLKHLNPDENQVINIEAGNFNRLPLSEFDKALDVKTNNPGTYLFEKMVAGRYFGELVLESLKNAAHGNIFSAEVSRNILSLNSLSTADLNDFISSENILSDLSKCFSEKFSEDKMTALFIVQSLIQRNAKIVSIILSGVILKIHKNDSLKKPVCITAEGTTFYALKGLKDNIEHFLKETLTKEHGIKFDFISIENATLIGAAIAGLSS